MNEFSARALQPTPLHARTAELCATNLWSRSGAFTVPGIYTSEREEHEALVSRVGVSDLSARLCWRFEGPDAGAFLTFATTHDVLSIETGQTARVLWCDDFGHVRGEGVAARFGAAHYELSSTVRDFAWFMDAARGFDVRVTDVTGQRAGIGLRGPSAAALLQVAGFIGGARGKSDAALVPATAAWRQSQVSLVRDPGGMSFELWSDADDAIVIWDRVLRIGAGLGICPVGAVVLETVRLEAALPLAGFDWLPAQLCVRDADLRTPQDLGMIVDGLRRFNGSGALSQRRMQPAGRLVQVTSQSDLVRGDLIAKGGVAGQITSHARSHATERAVGIAWVKEEFSAPGTKLGLPGGAGLLDIQVVRSCHS
jgi:aminomethyltransferase